MPRKKRPLDKLNSSTTARRSTPEMPGLVLRWLRLLRGNIYGRSVDQLSHSLQAATLAVQAGADDDLVVAALCHDLGKVVSWVDHGKRSADILKPYVSARSYWIVATHHDFLAIYNTNRSDLDPYSLREKYARKRWYKDALTFADDWDSLAYDPLARAFSLRHFEPLVKRTFSATRSGRNPDTGFDLIRRLELERRRGSF